MNHDTPIAHQAHELELFATSTQEYYPRLQAIERLTQKRYDKHGEDNATTFAFRKVVLWLAAPARHYLHQHFVEPDFWFADDAISEAARNIAICIVMDCESGYYRED